MSRWSLAALFCAACYHPTIQAGAPCTDDDGCPNGQMCVGGFCGGADANMGGGEDGNDGALDYDAPPDAPLCQSFTMHHYFDPCAIPQPTGDLNLTAALADYDWDTTSNGSLKGKMGTVIPLTTMVMQQTGGGFVLVASVRNFTVESGVTVNMFGSKPLLLAVFGTANIAGEMDLSADFGSQGPGGNPMSCGASTGNSGQAGPPPSGGVGGGFQGKGGDSGNISVGGGNTVGVPTVIRGGCAGGAGGNGGGGAATRGAGGGALQIAAMQSITIPSTGIITASGGGGGGGTIALGGGGGGGAGGYIGLEAPSVTIAGHVASNGGGGGGGASDVAVGNGGGDGRFSGTAASGGAGAASSNVGTCTAGGNSSFGSSMNGSAGQSSPCGGGGGGGAAGYILIWAATKDTNGATISPPYLDGP